MPDDVRQPGSTPSPGGGVILRSHDGPGALPARMATMVHEFSSLLDGSLRQLSLLSRNLHEIDSADPAEHRRDVDLRVSAIRVALEQMAQTVRGVTRPRVVASLVAGRVGMNAVGGWGGATLNLADALRYAIAILEPRAAEQRIDLHLTMGDGLERALAGSAYTVVLNGLRNAIDAISDGRASGLLDAGRVELVATRVELADAFNAGATRAWAVIVITDDGVGPPPDPAARPDGDGLRSRAPVFESGFTTKPGHLGIGLSLSRELISEHGGSLDLRARTDRRGAELVIRMPLIEPGPRPTPHAPRPGQQPPTPDRDEPTSPGVVP